jgi:hypothetical protein
MPSAATGRRWERADDDPESSEMDPRMTLASLRDSARRWRRR